MRVDILVPGVGDIVSFLLSGKYTGFRLAVFFD